MIVVTVVVYTLLLVAAARCFVLVCVAQQNRRVKQKNRRVAFPPPSDLNAITALIRRLSILLGTVAAGLYLLQYTLGHRRSSHGNSACGR